MSIPEMVQKGWTLQRIKNTAERDAVIGALGRNDGCQLKAAAALGVHRNTLTRIMRKNGYVPRCRRTG